MTVYQALTPELILDAVESASGLRCDGRLQALNSYENRVYQLWLEGGDSGAARPVVAKFYRPQRWSSAAIQEEQDFATELAARELPVVAPLAFNGRTLHRHGGFQFALTPRRGGRTPELDDPQTLQWMGRFIARIHAVGQVKGFAHRPTLDIESFAYEPVQFVLDGDFLPDDLYDTYASVAEDVVERVERRWSDAGALRQIRLHGDCHGGNVLWTDDGPHFVDLDDARMGPAVQDLWMCLSGDRKSQQAQLLRLLEGYCEFREFDAGELMLIEALRTLRIVHYAGWLARRWDDPAFPANFPFFNTQHYWQDHILALREQAAALEEPPLQWRG